MPNYRRMWRPGGTFFFTLTLWDRRSDMLLRYIDAMRDAVRRTKARRPFEIEAWVVLPEHMHWIITLPDGDADYANRIKAMKIRFVRAIPRGEARNPARVSRGERGIWQRRFWEHEIRDETDFARHVDYIHFNPVKHGLVTRVRDWPYSTFHRFVERGVLEPDWGGDIGDLDTGER